ncbi:hypothetical protein Q9Q95_06705 [Sphingomonas sp. DG1-23]|uniref:hypothetical protein n=1 Tax=Sphingomonas sp. DG1-23 TaxID=3068316 RepID=UPI00273D27A1|nr:hypothetical protein [Sphingomonas sp. DG1-23]MDP5278608.1 hypothetical protein [Sphingomonas sp. DG1-23]
MPWNSLLAGATGGVAIFIVFAVLLGQGFISSLLKLIDTQAHQIELRNDLLLRAMDGYDQQLAKTRETRYLELWALTAPLPKWPRNQALTFSRLEKLSTELRDWYFAGGGLYLSQEARKVYGAAQEAICTSLGPGNEEAVPDSVYDAIQQALSLLRTTLTTDLATRREIHALEAIRKL